MKNPSPKGCPFRFLRPVPRRSDRKPTPPPPRQVVRDSRWREGWRNVTLVDPARKLKSDRTGWRWHMALLN